MAWDDDKHWFTARYEHEVLAFLDAVAAAMDEDEPAHVPGVTAPSTRAPSRVSAIRHLRATILAGRLPRLVREVEHVDPKEMARYWRELQAWHRVTLASYQRHQPTPPVRPWSGEPAADLGDVPDRGNELSPAPKRAKTKPKRSSKPTGPRARPTPQPSPQEPTDEQVLEACEMHRNKSAAARALGIPRTTLASRLDRLGVQMPWDGRAKHTSDPESDPTDEEVLAAFEKHRSRTEAARQLGLPRSTLSDRLKRLGVEPDRRMLPEESPTDEEVLAAFEQCGSKAEAARALGIPRTTLTDRLKRLGEAE